MFRDEEGSTFIFVAYDNVAHVIGKVWNLGILLPSHLCVQYLVILKNVYESKYLWAKYEMFQYSLQLG